VPFPKQATATRLVGPDVAVCAVVVLGGVLLTLSAAWPWLVVDAAGDSHTVSLTDLPAGLGFLLAGAASLAIIGGAIAERAAVGCPGLEVAGVVAAVVAVLVTVFLVGAETAAAIIPRHVLPVTARRASLDLGTCRGAWLALASALLVVGATSDRARYRVSGAVERLAAAGPFAAVAFLALCSCDLALVEVREQPWASATVLGDSLSVEVGALPWVGPLSLVAVWLLSVALVVIAAGRRTLGGLISGVAGWLIASLATVTIGAGQLLVAIPADGPHTRLAPYVMLALGVTIAVLAAIFVHGGRPA
jgi:hypothetical protein